MMTFINKAFADADVNKNGVLTLDEFRAFIKVQMDAGAKRGNFEDPRPETTDKQFALMDQISTKPGVSLQDFFAVLTI